MGQDMWIPKNEASGCIIFLYSDSVNTVFLTGSLGDLDVNDVNILIDTSLLQKFLVRNFLPNISPTNITVLI